MRKFIYSLLTILIFISCTEHKEPWEKGDLSLDVKFVIESDEKRPSIINLDINDGSNGSIQITESFEKPDNLPFGKQFIKQRVDFYTDAMLSYKDRSPVKVGVPFEEYTITLKIFINDELKKEKDFLVTTGYENYAISYSFDSLFIE